MTSVLNVDSIAAKDGTSPVTLTKQSANKSYFNWDGSASTPTADDSFNLTTLTDLGSTGRYSFAFTNAMENQYYGHTSGGDHSASNNCTNKYDERSASLFICYVYDYNGNPNNAAYCSVAIQGDLA